ncbi:MAG: hypothetical protein VCD00_00590 [Candidatus Hydrogenedentota bacterium]
MKIRIQGNSIRLRLKQEEVTTLAETGAVEDRLKFGPDESQHLVYRLISADVTGINTSFKDGTVVVELPEEDAKTWIWSNRIGFEQDVTVGGDESIHILVEKDFKCLEDRPDEEDLFPNPNAGETC